MLLPSSGFARPILIEYLLSHYAKDMIHYTPDVLDIPESHAISFSCILVPDADGIEDMERRLVLPNKTASEEIANRIKNSKMNYILFTVQLQQKNDCATTYDPRQHMIMIVLNLYTERFYVYDLFRYSYQGFDKLNLVPHLKEDFTPWLNGLLGKKEIKFINAIPSAETSKIVIEYLRDKYDGKKPTSAEWFRLLCLWELHTMVQHDTLLRSELEEAMVVHMDSDEQYELLDELDEQWEKFVATLFHTVVGDCDLKNFDWELLRCIQEKEISSKKKSSASPININYSEYFHISNPPAKVGESMGILVMLMYFAKKYPNSRIFLPKNKTYMTSKKDFSIRWWYDVEKKWQLGIPKDFNKFFRQWKGKEDIDFVVIYISLSSMPKEDGTVGNHGNALIYNVKKKEIEHFEPHGSRLMKRYGANRLYDQLEEYFLTISPDIKYIRPEQFCNHDDFYQTIENTETGFLKVQGMCAVWTNWYIDVRLANPNLTRDQLVKKTMKQLHEHGSFRTFISSYDMYHAYMIQHMNLNYLQKDKKRRSSPDLDPSKYVPKLL